MPHGHSSREGPYGPPPIQRELPPFDAPPSYWGQPPPPARYPPPSPYHNEARSHRVPPPTDYHHGAPPPPPPQYHHQAPSVQYRGQWRESPPDHYYRHRGRNMSPSVDDYGRPYMPMQVEYPEPPHYRPGPPPPSALRAPPIQFRPNQRREPAPPPSSSMECEEKKSAASTSTTDGKKKKKGDNLSLLAKVSTAMADPEEEEQNAAEAAAKEDEEKQPMQQKSPPRGETSPVAMEWSTPKQYSNSSRQITPTSMDPHYRHPPPRGGGYYHQSYPRYPFGHPYYRNDSPPTVISERGSFEDDRMAYGSPPRHPDDHSHYAPYTYVQQPRLEEKTVLRKKFSWKHYPELERFLIANRDEYLRHSAQNYTAEQKQYNNWLTERLLEVAARHHYVFDPEDFSFVAVRDRIRCYYKSYVQTARKRGLPLVTAKRPAEVQAEME